MWDLATGQPIGGPLTGHTSGVSAVAVADMDGRPLVVSGSGGDRMVRVWDLATGAPVGTPFTGHTGGVSAVAVAEMDDRPLVVSGSFAGTVRVWDLRHRRAVRHRMRPIRLRHPGPLLALIVMPCARGLRAITGCTDNVSRTWRLPACRIESKAGIPGRSGIRAIAALTSGQILYASGSTIYLHETHRSADPILTIQLDSEIWTMAAHDGVVIAATKLGLVQLEILPLREYRPV